MFTWTFTGNIMPSENEFIKRTTSHVSTLFNTKVPPWALYHNFSHTEEVVATSQEIAEGEKLPRNEREVVELAAWFHDVGYIEKAEGHEERSAELAGEFLRSINYPEEKIAQVVGCILATRMPQQPKNRMEAVMCDADIAHIGKKGLFPKSELMRLEFERREGRVYTNTEWLNVNIEFLARQQFHTEYARQEFQKRRAKNLIALQERLREEMDDEQEEGKQLKRENEKTALREEKANRPERGIETMFRTVPSNHLGLSAMADQKANLLLSTSSIIITITVSLLGRKLEENPTLLVPTVVLLGVCLVTIVYAILVTRPKITSGTFTRYDIEQKKVNLLFFGNFHKASLEEFEWGMKQMMNDKDYLYGSMIRDLYYLGQVVGRKYRYLRVCYNVFLYGLILAVIAFMVAFLATPPAS